MQTDQMLEIYKLLLYKCTTTWAHSVNFHRIEIHYSLRNYIGLFFKYEVDTSVRSNSFSSISTVP